MNPCWEIPVKSFPGTFCCALRPECVSVGVVMKPSLDKYVLSSRDPGSHPSETHLVGLGLLRLPDSLPLTWRAPQHFSPSSPPTCTSAAVARKTDPGMWREPPRILISSLFCGSCLLSPHMFLCSVFSDHNNNPVPVRRGTGEV